jgi:hypothetical protein
MKNAVFWMLRRLAIVRNKISEGRIASIIRVKEISQLRTTLAVIDS